MTQATVESVLTPEVKAMIGVKGEMVECWGTVDEEYLRRFIQAIMDPDPLYWDEEYAKKSRYGERITPPIMVSYMGSRLPPGEEDPITRAFRENPMSDGIGGVRQRGGLPPIPTKLVRILNAGNDIEVYKFPSIGDKIRYQSSYKDIQGHVGRDGTPFLTVVTETRYWNQKGELLCITRAASIRR